MSEPSSPIVRPASVRPARPHTGLTEDGRRLAQVLTYTKRGNHLTDEQAKAWQAHSASWWIPDEAADAADFDVDHWFGRSAPLVVEIGSGVGESTAALAARRPDHNVLAFEVWRPGVAQTFQRLEKVGATNVRMMSIDAVWSMEHLFPRDSISEAWTFFPDPWPKRRHHQRRLVTATFARVVASRLAPGGLWRLATDWPAYAGQIADVLAGEELLENVYDGPAPRWDERPVTRFERRGHRAGHPITDFTFRRS